MNKSSCESSDIRLLATQGLSEASVIAPKRRGGLAILTQERFLERALARHGTRYDYSEAHCTGATVKLRIICRNPAHGPFMQTPDSHVHGHGCSKCATEGRAEKKRYSLSGFLAAAHEVHGDLYDYSSVMYSGSAVNVSISCRRPEHGLFQQTPTTHLSGSGCPKCGDERASEKRRMTQEAFLFAAHNVHGSRYDYSEAIYNASNAKILIICQTPGHGSFRQTPNKHLAGQGCIKCGFESTKIKQRTTTEAFLVKCRNVHGDRYDYSEAVYEGVRKKVHIVCRKLKHGTFMQEPGAHLQGQGCPKCRGRISAVGTAWLDSLGVPVREYRLPGTRTIVDGFNPATNTVYQFHGDYYHGNPARFEPANINPSMKITFGELYQQTSDSDVRIEEAGYILVTMWEHDWNPTYRRQRRLAAKLASVIHAQESSAICNPADSRGCQGEQHAMQLAGPCDAQFRHA